MWSGAQPQKHSVASVHGRVAPLAVDASTLYQAPLADLRAAYAAFNASFPSEAPHIDVALFTADGDLIHQFIDCMFLGPYTRVDYRTVDERLSPIFWARDENGGQSRNFTACFGDVMYGDHQLPYTCGSPVRRSIIKFFIRDYLQSGRFNLQRNVSQLILQVVRAMYANYTAPGSWGCLDAATGRCSLDACALASNGFAPCLSTSYEITQEAMGAYVVDTLLQRLEVRASKSKVPALVNEFQIANWGGGRGAPARIWGGNEGIMAGEARGCARRAWGSRDHGASQYFDHFEPVPVARVGLEGGPGARVG